MKYYVIEHWSYKGSWFALSEDERKTFAAGISQAVAAMEPAGIRTMGFGHVDHHLDQANGAFDFWSLWEMDSLEARDAFLAGVAESGWYNYFEHANTGGVLQDPAALMAEHVTARSLR